MRAHDRLIPSSMSQKEVARSRKLPITGKRSARPAGKPGDFLIAKESLQRSLPRHFLLSASNHTERSVCVFKAWRNLSVRCWSEQKPNPGGGGPTASRWSAPVAPGKRTRREDHALLIVRDEFRTGYSLIGLLASIARLRFTGTARINCGRKNENGISSNGKCVFPAVSHRRGSPHNTLLICVHLRSSAAHSALFQAIKKRPCRRPAPASRIQAAH